MRAYAIPIAIAIALLLGAPTFAVAQNVPPVEKDQCVSESELLAQIGDMALSHHDLDGANAKSFARAANAWADAQPAGTVQGRIPAKSIDEFTSAAVIEGSDGDTVFVQFFRKGCARGLIALAKHDFFDIVKGEPGA